MPDLREILKRVVKELSDNTQPVFCTVKSRDDMALNCVCTPINGQDAEYPDVRLVSGTGNGIIFFPQVDSIVLVQPMMNDQTAYLAMVSQLDKIQFLDGSFGGLTKTQELKTQIDKLNAQLQAVISSLQNWTVIPSDGGAALKSYFAIQISGKPAGDFSNIENPNITHGNI